MSLRDRVNAFLNPEARRHVVDVRGSTKLPSHLTAVSGLRRRPTRDHTGSHLRDDQPPKRGMWVSYSGRTGILTDLEPGDVASVMLVDDAGLNALAIHVPAAQLRQAWFEEIPAPRRPKYEDAVRFGYHTRPA